MTDRFDELVRIVARARRAEALFDTEMRYLAASPGWRAELGLMGPFVGRRIYDLTSWIGERWKTLHRRCLAGATARSEGERFERRDGAACWFAWEIRPWREAGGAIGGLVIAIDEVTDRFAGRFRPGDAAPPPDRPTASARAVAARIASVRFRLDRTEREFARLLGVPRAAVSDWESGRGVAPDDLRLIAERTETSLEWLAGGPATPVTPPGPTAPPREDRLLVRRVRTDERPPAPIGSEWAFRPDCEASHSDRTSGARGPSPSALFLRLPGVSAVSGARSARYRLEAHGDGEGDANFLISLSLGGRRRLEQGGRTFEGDTGAAVCTSSEEDGRFWYDPEGRYLGLFLAARPIRRRVPRIGASLMQPIAPDGPALRLLAAYVAALMKSDGLDPEGLRAAADHVVDLCALALGATGDERALAEARGLRAALRSAIREAIEAGAASPGFSAQAVAEQLGVSTRYLHFLLEDCGAGFGSLVTARRLAVVRDRLADPSFAQQSIPEIAAACGFVDLRRFEQQFAARFGDTPGAARSAIRR